MRYGQNAISIYFGVLNKYRNNASKRPSGRCDFARVKKHPGAFTAWPGRFLGSGAFCPPGAKKKEQKKLTPLTHSQQQPCSSKRCWSCRNPATPRTPSTGKGQRSLRRPGQAAPAREGTPAPGPAPAAQQVLQRGPLPRIFPPSFALERSVGTDSV